MKLSGKVRVSALRRNVRKVLLTGAVTAALLLAGLLLSASAPSGGSVFAPAASAQSGLLVSNHVLTTRVVRTADGGFFVQDILIGFQRGTASFQTLTQVILPRGSHQLSMALFDPAGRELERISFGTVRADADNDTLSLEGTWRNIRFEQAGVHELVLYWQGRAVARFHLVVR